MSEWLKKGMGWMSDLIKGRMRRKIKRNEEKIGENLSFRRDHGEENV